MRGKIFLPCFAIAYLMALRKTIAISIDAALFVGINERTPCGIVLGRTVLRR